MNKIKTAYEAKQEDAISVEVPQPKMKRVFFSVTPEMHRAIRVEAINSQMTASDFLRRIIQKELNLTKGK